MINEDQIIIENKVGVDPVSGGTVRKTSDQFFKLNNDNFDCIFKSKLLPLEITNLLVTTQKDIKKKIKNVVGVLHLHHCLSRGIK